MSVMPSLRIALLPALVGVVFALTGCNIGGGDDGIVRPGDALLADDLDLDSYQIEGTIDGLSWTGEVCALNLIPSLSVYFEGTYSPYYTLYFEAYDKAITGGVVTGIWRLGGDINHPVQINSGTWSKATSADAQTPGTISVELSVTEYFPAGGHVDRVVAGTLNLTPTVTSDECVAQNDVEYLRDALETYGGPTGG